MSLSNADWYVLRNPFDSPTKGSYTLLDIVATDHLSKLKVRRNDNAAINNLYLQTKSKQEDFYALFSGTKTLVNIYRSKTSAVTKHFKQLYGDGGLLENWEARVTIYYPRNTTEYKDLLFPHGRKPFGEGGHERRAIALHSFIQTFASFSNLNSLMDALRQEMQAFYDTLVDLRDKQQQEEQKLANKRRDLKLYRPVLIEQLNYNKNMLLCVHREETERLLDYFEVGLLRRNNTDGSTMEIPADDITPETDDNNDLPTDV